MFFIKQNNKIKMQQRVHAKNLTRTQKTVRISNGGLWKIQRYYEIAIYQITVHFVWKKKLHTLR